jgi:ligand-binding sensor domain-containing protein/serine/threonine protein kinase
MSNQKISFWAYNILWLALVFLFFPLGLKAQTLRFERFSLEQGLSQSFVSSIVQDKEGFIWFSTNDGLNRYDGYNFKVFRNEPKNTNSLPKGAIFTTFIDSKGIIWIGVEGKGLSQYDPLTNKAIQFPFEELEIDVNQNDQNFEAVSDKLSNSNIISIYEDKEGQLWLGTLKGLSKFDRKNRRFTNFYFFKNQDNLAIQTQIVSTYQDSFGFFWFGSAEGLVKFDPKYKSFETYTSNTNNFINSICEDDQGFLWLGTGKGISVFDPKKGEFLTQEDLALPQIPKVQIKKIVKDDQGNFWIGSYGEGLYKYNTKTKNLVNYRNSQADPNSLSSNNIISLYIDKSGILWVGTTSGISRTYPKAQFFDLYTNNINDPSSLSSNFVMSLFEDKDKTLWIGTLDTGLNKYDPKTKTFAPFYSKEDTTENRWLNRYVRAIHRDKKGNFWVGSQYGIIKYDTQGKVNLFDPDSFPPTNHQTNVSKIFETKSGDLYIGTEAALYRYNYEKAEFIRIAVNLVTTIYEDKKGNIWFGTYYEGLYCYDPKTEFISWYKNDPSNPNSLSYNRITAIHEDRTGSFWVATYGGGLNLFDQNNKTFKAFTVENTKGNLDSFEDNYLNVFSEGLPNDVVYGILEDSKGNLWLSTNQGLSKFTPKTMKFRNYNALDGLQSNEFNTGAFFKSESGEMFFGGINGFNRFFPESVKDNLQIPTIKIMGFNVFNKARNISGLDSIELPYRDNFFSFEFVGLSYIRTEKNLYAYKMEGFDKDWVYSGTRRYASYTNLDPGTYIFKVKGSNNDGIWNEEGTTIKIVIKPPFWRTWWAYSFYFVFFIGSIVLFVNSRVKKIKFQAELREAKLKTLVAEQEAKTANEIKQKNQELEKKNTELLELHQRADRIFSALAKTLPGTVLDGKYRLEEQIGLGGFGIVYRATHLAIKKDLAIKVFRPMPGNDSAESLSRFQQEAISACKVNHPNAVSVLDSGISSGGIAYLVMELLSGHTLKAELKEQKSISLKRTVEILLAVCQVLAKAHSVGIIHRDIKPDNIFLHKCEEGEVVKVLDFGIAKLTENAIEEKENLTGTGKLIGTPVYMSPERLMRQPYDGRSDVYSVGIIFYEVLSGRPPFLQLPIGLFGEVSLPLAEAQSIKSLYPHIPKEVDEIITKALSKNTQDRFTAKEMGENLQTLLDSISSSEDVFVENNFSSDAPTLENNSNTKSRSDKLTVSAVNQKNTARWKEIEELFNHLLEIPTLERDSKLLEICPDIYLQAEVKSLLESLKMAEKEKFSLSLENGEIND